MSFVRAVCLVNTVFRNAVIFYYSIYRYTMEVKRISLTKFSIICKVDLRNQNSKGCYFKKSEQTGGYDYGVQVQCMRISF